MPKVFVHGNPETSALWQVLEAELGARGVDDVITLSPPGFGAAVPAGFEPTQRNYRDWLITELADLDGQVDLVGHDWGAGHVFGVLAERPDLLRSWAADCGGLLHPDYVWHDMAQIWATPGVGEEAVQAMFAGSVEERAAGWAALGIQDDVAAAVAAGQDDTMGRCIVELYRSAVQPALRDLGARLRTTEQRPGLVIIATDDQYAGTPAMAAEVAAHVGATTVTLEGEGHWWMFGQGAATAADALIAHWSRARR